MPPESGIRLDWNRAMNIGALVKDWGGFEQLVAKLNETGEVTVEHNVKLTGRSGAVRQIDVLIHHKEGLYEHLVVAECKYWNVPVDRLQVDALATTVREVGASRGVIFSTKGFQAGAITQAQHDNIDLFTVRDLFDSEWGSPGRIIDLILQVIQPSIGNLAPLQATRVSHPNSMAPIFVNIQFGPEGPLSSTPSLSRTGASPKTVEKYLMDAVSQGVQKMLAEFSTINGGAECTRYMSAPQNVQFSEPLLLPWDGETVAIPRFCYELGLKITQSRITVDRGANLAFALAVENCVNGAVSAASRGVNQQHTTITELKPQSKDPVSEAAVPNGSVMRVVTKGFFPFEEMSGHQRIPIDQLRREKTSYT